MNATITAAAYIRVSTSNQVGEDKFGLDTQKDAITTYAEKNCITIVEWYSDEGISGGRLDRPALQQMLKNAAEGKFTQVLVAKTDRVARDLYIQLFVEKELKVSGVELVSTSEPLSGSDPMTAAFRQMVGVFAELEKNMITWRLSGGRKQKAKHGGYSGGGAPLGYKTERGSKVLHLDDQKSETVKKVFDTRREHPEWTLQQIADCLNEAGYTTAKHTPFHKMQVKRVLDRKPLYSGQYVYSGIECTKGKQVAILG